MALINQTLRDAKVSRETRALERAHGERLDVIEGKIDALLAAQQAQPAREPRHE